MAYSGIFLLSASTILLELLFARLFSVTMWFHFAFVAVSIAMFGMTAGALWIHLWPERFRETDRSIASGALGFGCSSVAALIIHLCLPFSSEPSVKSFLLSLIHYTVISVPFIFSGLALTLCLTRRAEPAGKLYAADLAGAGAGCVAFFLILQVMDLYSALILNAAVAAAGARIFSGHDSRPRRRLTTVLTLLLVAAALGHALLFKDGRPILRVQWVKGQTEEAPLYEAWNSFSRVTVRENRQEQPYGYGLSERSPKRRLAEEKWLNIDSGAGTVMTRFSGDVSSLEHLRYDVTNAAHAIRPGSDVLVIGAGGGRDILSALIFGQRSVLALEVNPLILRVVNTIYGDFSGHLDGRSGVRFVSDEARSYLARSKERFDIIQLSFIDTNAATAAGAYTFTENGLYTREAWSIFFDRLSDDGVLSVSRWWHLDLNGEIYRVTALAADMLLRKGITDPAAHIAVLKNRTPKDLPYELIEVGTVLVSRSALGAADLERLKGLSDEMGFEIVQSPSVASDPVLALLAQGEDPGEPSKDFPLDLRAPTDDRPFFFSMLPPGRAFDGALRRYRLATFNMKAIFVLSSLLAIVVLLCGLCLFLPLLLRSGAAFHRSHRPLLAYFFLMGLSFMFVEISQMQRMSLFLGHPAYGLTVVLSSLLLGAGMGSFFAQHPGEERLAARSMGLLTATVGVLALGAMIVPAVTSRFESFPTALRIALALALNLPGGFVMGFAFPVGMRQARRAAPGITGWLWGLNGAASVLGSVLSVALSLQFGIGFVCWLGVAGYACLALCYIGSCSIEPGSSRSSLR